MTDSPIRVALSMGINGDDPEAFAALARDLGCREIVVNHRFYDAPETMHAWAGVFARNGLRVVSWAIPYLAESVLASAAARAEFVEQTARAFQLLGALGVATAHTFAMIGAPPGAERDRRYAELVDAARGMCSAAAQSGVRVAFHFGWTPDQLVWNAAGLRSFLDDVGCVNCGLLLCPGSVLSAGDDAVEAARQLASRSFLVHLRDARRVSAECEALHLGQGRLPVGQVLAALRDGGYRGVVVPEHLGPAAGQTREEIAQALAAGYLRGLLECLGRER